MSLASRAPSAPFRGPSGERLSLEDLLARAKGGRLLLAFFKTTCPTCQLAWPYLDRLASRYAGAVHVVGVSQDPIGEARAFHRENGNASFDLILDPAPAYEASNAWGVVAVPHLALVEPDGTVSTSFEGWQRKAMEELAARFAAAGPPVPFIDAADPVPAWKAG